VLFRYLDKHLNECHNITQFYSSLDNTISVELISVGKIRPERVQTNVCVTVGGFLSYLNGSAQLIVDVEIVCFNII